MALTLDSKKLTQLKKLVQRHQNLDEAMTGAIWIKQSDPHAWLIEIMPDLPSDQNPYQPFVFTPSPHFRYSLHLIGGNIDSLIKGLKRNKKMAREVLEGIVLYDSPEVQQLIHAAKQALR
jgi:hypothetical protein